MSASVASLARIIKHVWTEPKLVAQTQWHRDHPSFSSQLEAQLGRPALEQFVAGGGWPDEAASVTVVIHEPPDFDWWEPRHDQPWRRQAARNRGDSA